MGFKIMVISKVSFQQHLKKLWKVSQLICKFILHIIARGAINEAVTLNLMYLGLFVSPSRVPRGRPGFGTAGFVPGAAPGAPMPVTRGGHRGDAARCRVWGHRGDEEFWPRLRGTAREAQMNIRKI